MLSSANAGGCSWLGRGIWTGVLALGIGLGACKDEPISPSEDRSGVLIDSLALRQLRLQQSSRALVSASSGPRLCHLTSTTIPNTVYSSESGTGTCLPTVTVQPANPALHHDEAQPSPITITFSQLVYEVTIESNGAVSCSGTFGSVTGTGPQGSTTASMQIIDPLDCGEDDITYGARATVRLFRGLQQITIQPFAPMTWQLPNPPYPNVTAHGYANYVVSFYETLPPPPAANCPTGDSLLDIQALRAALDSAWKNSNVADTAPNRSERGGYLFRDTLTGDYVFRLHPSTSDTPCSSFNTPTGPLPGQFVAGFHTHPFTHLEPLPPNCHKGPNKGYDAKKYGGPSKADFNRVANDGLAQYIVDKDNIYLAPKGSTISNWKSTVKSWPRTDPQSGCVRL